MTLAIGSFDGVYIASNVVFDDSQKVLDCGRVLEVESFDNAVFAATKTGLYRAMDSYDRWTKLDIPTAEVYSIHRAGEYLFASTHPPHIYRSKDEGETWEIIHEFDEIEERSTWRSPVGNGEPRARFITGHPELPERLIVGVDRGGIYIGSNYGKEWKSRNTGVGMGVQHINVIGETEYIVSCSTGLYLTMDSGRAWQRLDTEIELSQFRESLVSKDSLYACGAEQLNKKEAKNENPKTLGFRSLLGRGAKKDVKERDKPILEFDLYESIDMGETFKKQAYPASDKEVVLALLDAYGHVFAGTHKGRVIMKSNEGVWVTVGAVPERIESLSVI